jgi:hypothetical protein
MMTLVGIIGSIFSRSIRRSVIGCTLVLALIWIALASIGSIRLGNPDAVDSQASALEQYQERPARGDLCNQDNGLSGVIVWDKIGPGYSCEGPAPVPPVR